jgi:hypothetical protein
LMFSPMPSFSYNLYMFLPVSRDINQYKNVVW